MDLWSRRPSLTSEVVRDDLEALVEQIEADEVDRVAASQHSSSHASHSGGGSDPLEHSASGERIVQEVGVATGIGASSDLHAARRVMGAAATVAGAAGLLAAGPVTGAALGTAALYAAAREGPSGRLTRRVGAAYLQVADCTIDGGLHAMDTGLKKAAHVAERGRQRLSEETALASLPPPLRVGVRAALGAQALAPAAPESGRSSKGGKEAREIRDRHPDRVPVICERSPYSPTLPELSKKRMIVPGTLLCGEFKYMVHKQLTEALAGGRPGAEQTIYLFVQGLAPKTSTPMSELYEKFRADDGFLYLKYGAENTLG